MADIEVLLPKMGESVAEATIIKWLKEEGDTIEADESIIEIATDKVDSEVPAPADGVLIKRLFNEGDVVKVGEVIAIIGSEASASASETTSKGIQIVPKTLVVERDDTVHHSEALCSIIMETGGSQPMYTMLTRYHLCRVLTVQESR